MKNLQSMNRGETKNHEWFNKQKGSKFIFLNYQHAEAFLWKKKKIYIS